MVFTVPKFTPNVCRARSNICRRALQLGTIAVLVCSIAITWSPARADHLMKCDNMIVELGFTKSEVRDRCGDPNDVSRTFRSTVVNQTQGIERPRPGGVVLQGETSIGTVITVEVEKWFYNFGPRSFSRTLEFEDGKLVRIDTGHYGR